ncbi:MAG: TonB family protein [Acidobacteriota bacterium]
MHRQSTDGPGLRPPPSQHPVLEPGAHDTSRDSERLPTAGEDLMARLEQESQGDRQRLLVTLAIALVAHLALLLFVIIPEGDDTIYEVGKPGRVFLMEPVRFEKPPAPKQETRKEVPKEKRKTIPIPDPTPDEPEPIVVEDDITLPEPQLEAAVDGAPFGIPDAPDVGPSSVYGGRFDGEAFEVGNGISKPVAIHKPQPRFTEDARQRRIQGVVILSLVVDADGAVKNLRVVKGLPMGLTESALETVSNWRFKPATKDGVPVPVNFHLTIGFWLQ